MSVIDIRRGIPLRLTFGKGQNTRPNWSSDGHWVYFVSNVSGLGIYRKAADGSGAIERIVSASGDSAVHAISADGKTLVFPQVGVNTGRDLWMLNLAGDPKPQPLVVEPGDQSNAVLSPNGRWLAYHSSEQGEIYVRPFPATANGRWQVVASGGKWPLWSRDGKELFYVSGKGLMSVPVETAGTTFQWGAARTLFAASYAGWQGLAGPRNYDLSPDGKRFLVIKPMNTERSGYSLMVVQNWTEELERVAPPKAR